MDPVEDAHDVGGEVEDRDAHRDAKSARPPIFRPTHRWTDSSSIASDRVRQAQTMYTEGVALRPLPEEPLSRLPTRAQNQVSKHSARISENKWETGAWIHLTNELRGAQPDPELSEATKGVLEDMLVLFPTSMSHWRDLIKAEVGLNRVDAAKEQFRRCLSLPLLAVPLWRDYLA